MRVSWLYGVGTLSVVRGPYGSVVSPESLEVPSSSGVWWPALLRTPGIRALWVPRLRALEFHASLAFAPSTADARVVAAADQNFAAQLHRVSDSSRPPIGFRDRDTLL